MTKRPSFLERMFSFFFPKRSARLQAYAEKIQSVLKILDKTAADSRKGLRPKRAHLTKTLNDYDVVQAPQ